MTRQKNTIYYGKTPIRFQLQYNDRKTLGITVDANMNVLVKAPEGAEISDIYKQVEKKAAWILKQTNYFKEFHPLTPPRRYVSGETHLYLGKQYRLKVVQSTTEGVKLLRGFLLVYVQRPEDKDRVKSNLDAWYRKHTEVKFDEYLHECLQLFTRQRLAKPQLEIRAMPKRWGSYTPKGRLILNPELIKAPRRCVEYVIVHELCHQLNPSHNKAFYELLTQLMPDWERWKDRLERIMA